MQAATPKLLLSRIRLANTREYTFGYQLLEDQEFTGKLLSMRSIRSNAHFVPRIALCSTIYT